MRDQNGQGLAGGAVAWMSSDGSVATVDASGQVTAAGNGTATITARAGSASGTAEVTVAQEVRAVAVSPAAATLVALGDALRLVAEATDANGHGVVGLDIAWSSSDVAVARVDDNGLVEAVAEGTATITAEARDYSGTAEVTVAQEASAVVVSPGATAFVEADTVRLSAQAVDANGHPVAGMEFVWDSSDKQVARVDAAGLVTALDDGRATITATARSVFGEATVAVARVARFLEHNPRIADAMLWLDTDNQTRPHAEWPQTLKDKLVLAVGQLLGEGTGLPDVMVNQAAEHLADGDLATTVLSREDAEDLYAANIAHSLILEMTGALPWSLHDLSERELELLLSSYIRGQRDHWIYSQGGFYTHYGPVAGVTGYSAITRALPAPPEIIRDFMTAESLVGGSRYETIIRTIEWVRYHLVHYHGGFSTGNVEKLWGYRGGVPLARMLAVGETAGIDGEPRAYTAGCHGTNWFLIHMLRAVNIPVEYIYWVGHAIPSFPSEGLYLSHGDDPYGSTTQHWPPFPETYPTSELPIPEATFREWFNTSNSSEENRNNVGRRTTELTVEYLPPSLLRTRCRDRAQGLSNESSNVYRPGSLGIGRYWTVAELEAMRFWERMDAKIAEYGGCANIEPPRR